MGGDHKCPLCSATFTRPQHVGRHLRAHTGDRPYECKECPLRFARSDLLSRHVNKAHKPPDENGNPPKGKKGRRKSMPTSVPPPVPQATPEENAVKARRASFHQSNQMANPAHSGPPTQSPHMPPSSTQPQPPPLQAQSMYPHHPLLATAPQAGPAAPGGEWTSNPPLSMNNIMYAPSVPTSFASGTLAMPSMSQSMTQSLGPNGMNTFQPPFTAVPMRMSESDQGGAAMGRNSSSGSLNSLGYEFGFKKRACDQCNHSKVRCDFSEPCQRCANRNLRCSYNKPQKSRSIAALPTPRATLPNASASASMAATTLSGSSASPQSHYSSPHSISSPINSTMAAPNVPSQQATMPLLNHDPNQMMYAQSWQHNQWQNMNNQSMDPSYGTIQQSPQSTMYPSVPSMPSTTSSQYQPLPLQHRHSGSSSLSSPQNRLAPTPSLTSHSTSPDSDFPPERRTSSSSYTNNVYTDAKGQPIDPNVAPDAYLGSSLSPNHMPGMTGMQDAAIYQPDSKNFAWAPSLTNTIDPRQPFLNHNVTEEDPEWISRPPSSATTLEALDETALNALNERRRSSIGTGVWANAFNQMTLQDGIVDPYTASQYAQAGTASARRPSYPITHQQLPEGSNMAAGKIPSLGDVKDLWKLFMSEPMTSSMNPSNSAEAFDYSNMGSVNSAVGVTHKTPPVRPGPGPRGLSRSNSMPDLTSPLLTGNLQPFFSTHAITPKPALQRSSYMQSQYMDAPVDLAAAPTTTDEGLMRSWKDSIKNRQDSFEFDANAQSKIKSTLPNSDLATLPADSSSGSAGSMGSFNANNFGRPLASVLQHSSALQQTLAPERIPSFGGDNLHTPIKPTFRANAAKFSSSLARPGNKRLASQTLVPNDGKKTSGEAWEDSMGTVGGEDDGSGNGFSIPTGLAGGTGMTLNPMLGHQYFAWTAPPPPAVPGMGMGHHSAF